MDRTEVLEGAHAVGEDPGTQPLPPPPRREEAVRGVRARVVSCAASENALRRARSRLPHGLVVPPQGLKGSDADAAAA